MIDKNHPGFTAPGLTSTDRMAVLVIAAHTGPDGWCHKSKTELARYIGVDRANTVRAIQRVVKRRVITQVRNPHDGRQHWLQVRQVAV